MVVTGYFRRFIVFICQDWAGAPIFLLPLLREHYEANRANIGFLQVLFEHIVIRLEKSNGLSLGFLLQSYLLPSASLLSLEDAALISVVGQVLERRVSSLLLRTGGVSQVIAYLLG